MRRSGSAEATAGCSGPDGAYPAEAMGIVEVAEAGTTLARRTAAMSAPNLNRAWIGRSVPGGPAVWKASRRGARHHRRPDGNDFPISMCRVHTLAPLGVQDTDD